MNRSSIFATVGALAFLVATPSAMAQINPGSGFPTGGVFYNLHILGAKSCKNAPLTFSNRHTIFVPLVTSGDVPPSSINPAGTPEPEAAPDTAIFLVPPPPNANFFQVCDGNSCNPPVDCLGNPVDTGAALPNPVTGVVDGAVFQLPCDSLTATGTLTTCASTGVTSASYSIWAEALGKPGGQAQITTCATVENDVTPALETLVCSTNPTHLLVRSKGNPKPPVDVTIPLTTLTCSSTTCPTLCAVSSCTFEIFSTAFEGFFWDYDNLNLKNLELRFYLNPNPKG